jgi:hypothetical protein
VHAQAITNLAGTAPEFLATSVATAAPNSFFRTATFAIALAWAAAASAMNAAAAPSASAGTTSASAASAATSASVSAFVRGATSPPPVVVNADAVLFSRFLLRSMRAYHGSTSGVDG